MMIFEMKYPEKERTVNEKQIQKFKYLPRRQYWQCKSMRLVLNLKELDQPTAPDQVCLGSVLAGDVFAFGTPRH